MYVGLGYTLVARNVENQSDRKDLLSKAEYHYKAALDLDHYDHLCQYYIALHYAETRRPEQAKKAVKRALELNPEHISAIHRTLCNSNKQTKTENKTWQKQGVAETGRAKTGRAKTGGAKRSQGGNEAGRKRGRAKTRQGENR